MKSGKRRTANKESDVKALAGVNSPPSNVNNPNETTMTTTGILFNINVFNCNNTIINNNSEEIFNVHDICSVTYRS